MEKIVYYVKRLCFSLFLIYSLNLFLVDLNVYIPINVCSITVALFLGIPGIISILLLSIFII